MELKITNHLTCKSEGAQSIFQKSLISALQEEEEEEEEDTRDESLEL